jgi:putative FmdB family regulatory protein
MPTYEYVCAKCGHEFDKIQPISAKPLTVCPADSCRQKRWGKGKVKRAISAGGGLLFKGSGFYITDYRSENYKAGAKKDSAPAASSGDAKSSSKDAKPAPAKAESKPAEPTPAKTG